MTHHRWRADPILKKSSSTNLDLRKTLDLLPTTGSPVRRCIVMDLSKDPVAVELVAGKRCERLSPNLSCTSAVGIRPWTIATCSTTKFRVVGTPLWCCLHAMPDPSEATDWKWIPAWLGLQRPAARWTKWQPQESMDDPRGTGTPERPPSRMLGELPRVSAWPRGCPVAAAMLKLVLHYSLVTEVGICHLLASQGRGDDGANHETQRCRAGHFQECPALDSLPRSRFCEWISDRLPPETRSRAIL